MLVLIVQNSDEILDCFIGNNDKEIIEKIKASDGRYWSNIVERLREEYEEEGEEFSKDKIDLDAISLLCHDGDSTDGYTFLERF